jgi:hypothetical protein
MAISIMTQSSTFKIWRVVMLSAVMLKVIFYDDIIPLRLTLTNMTLGITTLSVGMPIVVMLNVI